MKKSDQKSTSKPFNLRKFCPICGKETDELFEGLCRDCFLKNTELIKGPKRIEFGICYDCGRARFKKFWQAYESRDALIKGVIFRHVKARHGAILNVSYPDFTIKGKTEVPVDIEAVLSLDGKKLQKDYKIALVIFPEICPECSRMRGGYFEAIMQLRGERQEEMEKYIEDNIGILAKKEPNAFITKTEKLKEGIDIYVGSKDAARRLGSQIRKLYNVRCVITKKLHGMRQGKEIFRWTILLS